MNGGPALPCSNDDQHQKAAASRHEETYNGEIFELGSMKFWQNKQTNK